MQALENRLPPPLVALLVGAAMWLTTLIAPQIQISTTLRLFCAAAFLLCGFLFLARGFLAFRRARTTIDPVNLNAASSLVTDDVFRITRNPMYVGFTCLLMGWAVYLAAPLTFLGPVAFVAFITRFQIIPEERVMRAKFAETYEDYASRVRRWI